MGELNVIDEGYVMADEPPVHREVKEMSADGWVDEEEQQFAEDLDELSRNRCASIVDTCRNNSDV